MNKTNIVTINGQQYDAQTGLPVADSPKGSSGKKPTSAGSIHTSVQRSQTLIRRVTKKPTAVSGARIKNAGRTMDIARSSKVTRFAPHPLTSAPVAAASQRDLPATVHPTVHKVHHKLHARKQTGLTQPTKSSRDIKQEAIVAALAKPPVAPPKQRFLQRRSKALIIIVISIALTFVGGYLTYVNIPSWSVRVAAASAGINATYPGYRPDGYSLAGGPQWSDGEVTLNFTANTGTSKFSITQSKSSWDSSAVLDNVVREKTGEKYITNQERGLTIYTYSGNAAWVNGGILYIIEGDAPLSSEQLRRIATSL